MAAKHEQAARPERVSGTGRDEPPLQWSPVGDFTRRSHVIVLRISEALLVGTLQCPRDDSGGIDRVAVLPIVAILGHDAPSFFSEIGLSMRICRRSPRAPAQGTLLPASGTRRRFTMSATVFLLRPNSRPISR